MAAAAAAAAEKSALRWREFDANRNTTNHDEKNEQTMRRENKEGQNYC